MSSLPRVNVVYVRGTVQRLLPFLDNLLRQTAWRFTVVANGCTAEERDLLRAAAGAAGDRVELRIASTDAVLPHGAVLERLLQDEPSPYFCCLDSDIFAMGPVEIEELLPGEDEVATCSGLPMWHTERDDVMPDRFQVAAGRFLRTAGGDFLGCTYACCYRTDELRATLARWKVPLTPSRWEQLPAAVRSELDRRGLRLGSYDTLTVANILLQTHERPMVHREIKALRHLGAQSNLAEHVSLLRRPLRGLAWRYLPVVFRVLWRARGMSAAESAGMADFARRRGEAVRFADALVAGRATFGNAPAWVDPAEFDTLVALLGPRRSSADRGRGRDPQRAPAAVAWLKRVTPWWAKIGLKIPLSRFPITTAQWRRIGVFKRGAMTDPAVARSKLAGHLDRAGVGQTSTLLELGPGDSLLTGLIAHGEFGVARTIAIDAEPAAAMDFELYRRCAEEVGMSCAGVTTTDELLDRAGCSYLTGGLGSLRGVPTGSVDLAISDSVLEHVRRADFDGTIRELFRVLADGGVTSHGIDFEDHLSGALNSLRFSARRWESPLFADSGFYTNRLRLSEVLASIRRAGFEITSVEPLRWPALPIDRRRLHAEFAHLTDDDLLVSFAHVVATKPGRRDDDASLDGSAR